jgi:hypothetical protein
MSRRDGEEFEPPVFNVFLAEDYIRDGFASRASTG